jgi:hypothetical protein
VDHLKVPPISNKVFHKPTCRMAKLTYYTRAWYSHLVPQNTGISHHDWIMINMTYGTIHLCNYPVMQPIEVRFFSQFCDIRDLAQKKFSRQTLFSTRIQTFCQKKRQDISTKSPVEILPHLVFFRIGSVPVACLKAYIETPTLPQLCTSC